MMLSCRLSGTECLLWMPPAAPLWWNDWSSTHLSFCLCFSISRERFCVWGLGILLFLALIRTNSKSSTTVGSSAHVQGLHIFTACLGFKSTASITQLEFGTKDHIINKILNIPFQPVWNCQRFCLVPLELRLTFPAVFLSSKSQRENWVVQPYCTTHKIFESLSLFPYYLLILCLLQSSTGESRFSID